MNKEGAARVRDEVVAREGDSVVAGEVDMAGQGIETKVADQKAEARGEVASAGVTTRVVTHKRHQANEAGPSRGRKKKKARSAPSPSVAVDDDPILEVVALVQKAVPPMMKLADQALASASQALGVGLSEPTIAVHSEYDTRPAVANAPTRLVLMSQMANVPASPPNLMSSSSAPPNSPTIGTVSLSDDTHQSFCFSSPIITWLHFFLLLVF